ncbi:poly(3-hydroxybutyrate) depolymerase-like isoform X3 [Hyperolius riggenbachi]|uniref:poly(3-hydroxybutyrate) depolymerase-like isoform X3 n=1 Tax=Hyperolius riggenbachi TaxID=752182 RepID=UPI0035A275CF
MVAQSLSGSYNLDSSVTVSGLSSGAYMANQFHIALSGRVTGAAIFAGGPYYCALGNSVTASTSCMTVPGAISVAALRSYAVTFANTGQIDPLSNLGRSKVFIFCGSKDSVLVQGVAQKLQEFYSSYISAGNIKTVYNVAAQHGMPTDSYGGACGTTNNDYINNCNYNGAYEALNHLYGGLSKPSSSSGQTGQLNLFDQSEYFNLAPASTYGMDTAGYIYVPTACQNGARCRLHIAFHGCLQGREKVGDKFARYAGYNQVADLNNFIILYPQARSLALNPNGCWDWFGYSGITYPTKNGFQITGVERMMKRTMGQY